MANDTPHTTPTPPASPRRSTGTPRRTPNPRPQQAPAPPPTSTSNRGGETGVDTGQTPSAKVLAAIKKAATENGVPLVLALAIAQHESGFQADNKTGDNGHSWGLYQLEDTGEGSGMGNRRLDPYTNASTALRVVGSVLKQHPDWSWGQIAAAAQRPADAVGYAGTINDIVKRAQRDPEHYFTQALAGASVAPGDFAAPTAATHAAAPAAAPVVGTSATPVVPSAVGGGTGGTTTQTASAQFTANPTLAIQDYGYIAALAKSNPELKKLMAQYANQDLSVPAVALRLEGEIRNTKWYQRTNDAQRAAQVLQATNPTEYHRQFANELLTVTTLANKLGVQLPGLGLHDFAVNAYNNGWTPDEQQHFLLAQASYKPAPNIAAAVPGQPGSTPAGPTGDIGATLTKMQQEARDYMVPISDQAQQKWASDLMQGKVNDNDYTNYLKEQAKSLFPSMGSAIDSGVTPSQYTDPYKQIAAQTLQVPPDSVNFSDPKWGKALFQIDPKTGARTAMSLADWGKTLRSDPVYGYAKTPAAQSQAADFAENILNTFGAVGNYGGNG